MERKSRVNIINSVAYGQKVPCPKCGTLNPADCNFCKICGAPIGRPEASLKEVQGAVKADEKKTFPKTETPIEEVIEEPSVFAQGLPAWDVIPPQVVVRRKRR